MKKILKELERFFSKNIKFSFIILLVIIALFVKNNDNNFLLGEGFSLAKAVPGSSPVQTAQLAKSDDTSIKLAKQAAKMTREAVDLADKSGKASKEAIGVRKTADKLAEESNKIMDESIETNQKNIQLSRDINLSKSDTVNSMKELVKESPDVDTPTLSKSNPVDEDISIDSLDAKYVPPPEPKVKEKDIRSELDTISKKERSSINLRYKNRLAKALARFQVQGELGKWKDLVKKSEIEFITGPFSDKLGIEYNKHGYTLKEIKEKSKKALVDYIASNPGIFSNPKIKKIIVPFKYTNNSTKRMDTWVATSASNIQEQNVFAGDEAYWLYYNSV